MPNPLQKPTRLAKKMEVDARRAEEALARDPDFRKLDPLQKYRRLAWTPVRQHRDRLIFEEEMVRWAERLDGAEAKIRAGEINGMRLLGFLAYECTRRLERWSHEFPEYVAEVAKEYTSWPVLATRKASDVEEKLAKLGSIQLATVTPFIGTPPQTSVDPCGARKWALNLKKHIESARPRETPLKSAEWEMSHEHSPSSEFMRTLRVEAPKLPRWSRNTKAEWWKLADKLLLDITNNKPWEDPDLAYIVATAKIKNETGRTDGMKRSAIRQAIKQAFEHLS